MQLFRSEGNGRYRDVTADSGAALTTRRVHRGIAVGDYDGDGDPDFLVSVCNGSPLLLRNDTIVSPTAPIQNPESKIQNANWLWIEPVGVKSNRDGIGTRITVVSGGRRQTGWVRSGSSYCSASDLKAYFGLGSDTKAESIELAWPSGHIDRLERVKANQVLRVTEGEGTESKRRGSK